MVATLFSGLTPAAAQAAPNAVITVPAIMFLQPGKPNSIPLGVGPPNSIEKASFIRLSGLPPTAELSKGYVIAPNVWSVPVGDLPGLTMTLVGEALGRWTIAIHLVSVGNATLAEAKTVVVVVPPGSAQPADVGAAAGPGAALVATPQLRPNLSPADRERALVMVTNGEEQLKNGNVYAARKFFERAAAAGLAQGALALGATFDATELARLNVVGLKPDAEAARQWYMRAQVLGAAEAETRLQRLAK